MAEIFDDATVTLSRIIMTILIIMIMTMMIIIVKTKDYTTITSCAESSNMFKTTIYLYQSANMDPHIRFYSGKNYL